MRIAFGTDDSTELTEGLCEALRLGGHDVTVVADGIAWPDAGRLATDPDPDEAAEIAKLP